MRYNYNHILTLTNPTTTHKWTILKSVLWSVDLERFDCTWYVGCGMRMHTRHATCPSSSKFVKGRQRSTAFAFALHSHQSVYWAIQLAQFAFVFTFAYRHTEARQCVYISFHFCRIRIPHIWNLSLSAFAYTGCQGYWCAVTWLTHWHVYMYKLTNCLRVRKACCNCVGFLTNHLQVFCWLSYILSSKPNWKQHEI